MSAAPYLAQTTIYCLDCWKGPGASGWEQFAGRGTGLGHIRVAGEVPHSRMGDFAFFHSGSNFIQIRNCIDCHLIIFNFLLQPSAGIIGVSSFILGVGAKVAWEGHS